MAQTIVLHGPKSRSDAANLCRIAPNGTVAKFSAPARTVPQNSRFWAMISEISRAKPEGRDYPPETWRSLFMAAAGFRPIFQPALDGEGLVPIGYKSSRLTKAEFSELFLAVEEYAARHGIVLADQQGAGRG
jgi:hypothetical protein